MTGAQGGGKQAKGQSKSTKGADVNDANVSQIEYLLYQSTQGIHFMFENADIAGVMKTPTDDASFFNTDNMERVQGLLSSFLDKPTIQQKQSFLERLPKEEFELLVRAYFHLVENTILSHSNLRH